MIKTRLLLFTIPLLLFGRLQAQQPTGSGTGSSTNITFVVRNESTGFAVPGAVVRVTTPNGKVSTLTTAANGKLLFTAVNGKYAFAISANGYDPIETYFASGEETNIEANINLDPAGNNAPLVSEQQLRANVNQAIISGYVRDAEANIPLAGVQASAGGKTVITDSKGFFSIQLPAAATIAEATVPEKATIRFTKAGYAPHSIQNFYLIPDTYTMKVAMSSASNSRAQQITEETETQEHGLFDRKETDDQLRYVETAVPQARVEGIMAVAVPTSIRVGTRCNCTNCSSVQVMSLEKYVQTGLNDEWIASWGAASLRAGAVAYRTYGAYYVKHPVKSNFDIAATTCNQAWDSDGSSSCTNAANATAKVVLIKSGAIYRSEYSAENNNSGCGNGYSGTRSTWPCIKDERCAGRAKNGHGRGMCQWGSSFWARDK
ncbi:MAG TPA: carboxypeptidase regulatory-like domain-containing protein, partial [Niastella sp.]